MTRAYIRLDPAFDERKENYPDGPYAALIATFCLAEHQPERGRFRSLVYLRRLLGARGRHLRFLIDHGDLVELADGRAYVDGWDEWQEGDWKVAERVQRIRNRSHGMPPVTPRSTATVTEDVTLHPPKAPETLRQNVSVGISGGGDKAMSADDAGAPDEMPEFPVAQWLSQHGCYLAQTSGYYRNLVLAVERHLPDDLIAAMERLSKAGVKNGDVKGLLFGAIDELDAASRPSLSVVASEERAAERDVAHQRRLQATIQQAHRTGFHDSSADPRCGLCIQAKGGAA